MEDEPTESLWRARLKWRLRGALQPPVFVVTMLLGSLTLNRLPVAGDGGLDPVGGALLVGFLNLALVGFVGPVGARLVRSRRPGGPPPAIVADAVGARAMLGLLIVLVVAGVAHRPSVTRAGDDYAAQLEAVRNYLVHQAPKEYRAGLGRENVWKQGENLYRTCVPGPDPGRSLCLIVETGNGIPTVTRDDDQQSNSRVAGPDNSGRKGG